MDKSRYDNLSANGGSAQPNPSATPSPQHSVNLSPNLSTNSPSNLNSTPSSNLGANPSPNSSAMPSFSAPHQGQAQASIQAQPQSQSRTPIQTQPQSQSQARTSANHSNVAFKSDRIGQWSAKQDNPFAEQNRKAAEKKATQEAARKKALPYIKIGSIIAGCVAIVALAILIIITATRDPDVDYTPEIAGSSTEDIINYRDLLQQFYDRKKDETTDGQVSENIPSMEEITTNDPQEDQNLINSVNQVVQNTLDTSDGQDNANAVLSAQAYFYYNNGYYQEAIDTLQKVDMEVLDNNWKSNIYEVLANSYYLLGDAETANIYYDLLFSTPYGE